ncbi:MAG: hypothetical protein H6813_05375 [Phycisphaeraceae bacterium]|nr:hypothetical protein [Phycisphaeraceae bacterium]MCB9847815.1 hypothetical protein [Phycisphaeraceae bacterium]
MPNLTDTPPAPGASFPVDDWQFWVVTLVFLLAVAWLCWNVLPLKQIVRRGKAAPKRAQLTIEGRKPS